MVVLLRTLGFPFEPDGDGNFLHGTEARDSFSEQRKNKK